jgi:hypothetical protein
VKLDDDQRVSYLEAKGRVMGVLLIQKGRPMLASWIANIIWPKHKMKPQGAGAAAVRILKRMEREGLVKWKWNTRTDEHGWVLK